VVAVLANSTHAAVAEHTAVKVGVKSFENFFAKKAVLLLKEFLVAILELFTVVIEDAI